MIDALFSGLLCGAWLVGFVSVVFVGMTALAALVKLGRSLTEEKE